MTDGEERVELCRRLARALQQDLAGADAAAARAAAVRFAELSEFRALSLDELLARRELVTRSHALAVVAFERGFLSWVALLEAWLPELHRVTMYVDRMAAFLNRWFASYAEAAASRHAEGGFLLPFRKQFFVASRGAVAELGLDPDDPDWARIGYDWVKPRDAEAHLRLCRLRWQAMLERGEPLP